MGERLPSCGTKDNLKKKGRKYKWDDSAMKGGGRNKRKMNK